LRLGFVFAMVDAGLQPAAVGFFLVGAPFKVRLERACAAEITTMKRVYDRKKQGQYRVKTTRPAISAISALLLRRPGKGAATTEKTSKNIHAY